MNISLVSRGSRLLDMNSTLTMVLFYEHNRLFLLLYNDEKVFLRIYYNLTNQYCTKFRKKY